MAAETTSQSLLGGEFRLTAAESTSLLTPAGIKLDSTAFNSIRMKNLIRLIQPPRIQWYELVQCLFLFEFNDICKTELMSVIHETPV
jgi:hypothetical protein